MGKVAAGITVSLDGYVAGPDDGPGHGLGVGGERLHYWVFGGPWRYESLERGEPTGEDKAWLERALDLTCGDHGQGHLRGRAALGGKNPWGVPVFVLTHRPGEEPAGGEFIFVDGLTEAIERARAAAGEMPVHVMGGAQVVRQAIAAGLVDEFTLIIAPLVLGAGKRRFDGFSDSVELEHLGVRPSPFATFPLQSEEMRSTRR